MIREYRTVEEIVSPLMMVRMVENVTYDELVEVELHSFNGTKVNSIFIIAKYFYK